MAIPYEFHPEAEREFHETGRWYAERDLRMSDLLFLELDQAIKLITDMPETWPAYLHGTRRYLLDRFLSLSSTERKTA
jgi:plasmid stabilization system protein ParE